MSNNNANGNGKKNYPGRPKACDNIPQSKACKKTQKNGGMLCKNCPFSRPQ